MHIAVQIFYGNGLALSVTFGDTARVAAPSVCFAAARILLAAAPTAPPCFRHWRRSSPLLPKGGAESRFNPALSALRPHADIPSLPEGTARRHRQGCRRGELPSEHWTGRTVHRSQGSGRRPSGCERHGMLSGHPSLPAPFSGSGSCRPAEISERSGGRSITPL